MRIVTSFVMVALALCSAGPTSAADLTFEEVAMLCRMQPALQPDNVRSSIEEMLRRPHPEAWDNVSMDELIRFMQRYQGDECAKNLVTKSDVYSVIAKSITTSKENWMIAWSAVNVTCADTLTGACVKRELDAADAVRAVEAKEPNGREAPAVRVCEAELPHRGGWTQLNLCVAMVGDQHPSEAIIQRCLHSFRWHEEADGKAAGKAMADCFQKSG